MMKLRTELVATGDSILTRTLSTIDTPGFQELISTIASSDVAFTNLESVFPDLPRTPSTTFQGTHLGSQQSLLDEFPRFGFDVYGLANNHATDYGPEGLKQTLRELAARNMPVAGAGSTLREARRPVYVQTSSARIALIAAGSSNSRLAAAADPGAGDSGRPGLSPLRLQRTHHVETEKFAMLRSLLADTGVDVNSSGTTAPGVFLPYPDRNMWDSPPTNGFALEGIHFAPDDHSHIDFSVAQRDIDGLLASVQEARAQADLVFVALHCHEGENGGWNTDTPADFIRNLAHELIDTGAHAILGSGPHMLRGIELYRNRPICYSLGNFIFTLETLDSLPIEVYEQVGLDRTSNVSEFYDRITGYAERQAFWETVLPRLRFEDGEFVGAEIIPVSLGYGRDRGQRGCPEIAADSLGESIIERLASLSEPFDTPIAIERSESGVVGRISGE